LQWVHGASFLVVFKTNGAGCLLASHPGRLKSSASKQIIVEQGNHQQATKPSASNSSSRYIIVRLIPRAQGIYTLHVPFYLI
jgi:hypothetical protein